MSDFGTLISISKQDGSFSGNEISDLTSELKKILKEGEFENARCESFMDEVGEVIGAPSQLIARLSEHYYSNTSDEDNEDEISFVREEELEQAESITEKLKARFPSFTFAASVEDW